MRAIGESESEETFDIFALPTRDLFGDRARFHQLRQRVVEEHHSLRSSGLQDRSNLEGFLLANQIGDGRLDQENLDRGNSTRAIGGRKQPLRNDRPKRLGDHRADLRLLLGRKDVEDPIDGSNRVVGVEGGHHQVSGLGGGNRQRDGFEIPQLANHDHVRVFTQRRPERGAERNGLGQHLPLIDHRALGGVYVFNRIFHDDHVVGPLLVDQIHQRRHRRGLAAPSGSGDEHQSLMEVGEPPQALWKPELLEGWRRRGDRPKHAIDAALLAIDVPAETAHAADAIGEIEIMILLEVLALLRGEHLEQDLLGGGRRARGWARNAHGGGRDFRTGWSGAREGRGRGELDRGTALCGALFGQVLLLRGEKPLELLGGEKPEMAQHIRQLDGSLLSGVAHCRVELVWADQLVVDRESAQKGLVRRQIHRAAILSYLEFLEELVVVGVARQSLDQSLHRLDRFCREEHLPQFLYLLVLPRGEELLLFPGARLGDVDRRVDALFGEKSIEGDFGIAGPLELLEDHLVHPAAGVDQGGSNDRQRAGLLGRAGRAEDPLRTLEGARVYAAGQGSSGAVYFFVVGARE